MYNNNNSRYNGYGRLFFLPLLVICFLSASGQNLNNPNKTGPLGTQVNTLSGNLFIPRTDIYIPARKFDIDITFYYNSYLFNEDYGYGNGWAFRYNIKYNYDTTLGARLIFWGDGREDKYDSISSGGYKAPSGFFSTLSQYEPGKYVLSELDGMKYFFANPAHRRITRMEEPNGNFINFSYTDTLLTTITNSAGQSISFTYNPQGKLATVVDAVATPSRTFTYTYETGGNLKEVKDPLNGKYTYTYLVNGPMKSLSDKNNNKLDIIYFPDLSTRELIGCNKRMSFSYDTASESTLVTDHLETGNQVTKYTYKTVNNFSWLTSISGNCCGFNMAYEYDDQGNRIKMKDANSQEYNYTYDIYGNMLTATDPLGQVSTYTYTADFKKINSYKDPNGNLYNLLYDVKGNMTQLITPGNNTYTATYNANGDILTSTDPKGNIYTYNYDTWGNPITVSGPNAYNAAISYDARGNLLSYTDARGNNTSLEYDILDRMKKITDAINNSIQLTYDAEGNVVSYKNQNNEISTFDYDASNRLVKTTGSTGNQTSFSYDGMNNRLSIKNALNNESKFSYDNRNRLSSMKDAEENKTLYSYDGNGNVTHAFLPNGQVVDYTYDQLNRLTTAKDADGIIANLLYDKNGNIISYTNGTGATTTAIYDSLDRLKQVTDPLGNSSQYTYDKNNNIVSVTDREGHVSSYTYDGRNRIKTYTDNNGFIITPAYDEEGNIISLKDQNNNITSYTYDNLNRRKKLTYPDGKYIDYTYDNKGNITNIRLTDATNILYQYDTLNRIISRTLPGGEIFSYSYDKLDRVLTATNSKGTASFTYDKLNRVIAESFDGRTIVYNYNIAGRTQTTVYPNNATVIKQFDSRNRLTKILKDSVVVVEYAYNNANQLTNKTFSNGINTAMQYDFANRLSSINTSGGSIQNTAFTYDKEYNKTAIIRNNNPALSEQFAYDNGYRLINYKRGPLGSPVIQNTYSYDAVGNRTAANLNGTATTYTINNLNQLTAVNGTSFTFDNRGNITYDGNFYKTYDAENRLLKDSASPAVVTTYGYDALNRRVVKSVNGNIFKYTYSGAEQIQELDSSSSLLNQTVFMNFLSPVMSEKNSNKFYYHPDDLGSVEAISNNNGRLVEKYNYDPYGKFSRLDSSNNPLAYSIAGNRFGFTGQEYDSATSSYRFFFRNYSPETGVFNQRDLIEYEDGMGMYQYVGNNPVNGIDVWGLQEVKSKDKKVCSIDKVKAGQEVNDLVSNVLFSWKTGEMIAEVVNDLQLTIPEPVTGTGGPGTILGFIDLAFKGVNNYKVQTNPNSTYNDKVDAKWDVAGSGGSLVAGLGAALVGGPVGVGVGTGTGILALGDYVSSKTTGKNIRQHTEVPIVGKFKKNNDSRGFFDFIENNDLYWKLKSNEDWAEAKEMWDSDRGVELILRLRGYKIEENCSEGGTRKKVRLVWDDTKKMFVLVPIDPNLIIGPDGQPDKKWVSVNDRMPYTVLFENDSNATARARYIKITTPIEPKQDPTTLELGSVGFNNQSFDIPAGRPFYYQRLDARDSTGVYVDLTAGYNIVNNEIFWEFQAIDPLTLLPPEDPLAGFLFLKDIAQQAYGNGFVNFSIKPRSDAQTLDTIEAKAFIVFDGNEVIPTNIHTNTIDALPPTSQLNTLTATGTNPITLSWTGTDDLNGCGIDFYTIYVTNDQTNYSILFPKVYGNDTTFSLPSGTNYCFFILATDRVGNSETLRPGTTQCSSIGTPLPVTWLYFNGTTIDKNNLLNWATASEQNSKEYRVERSLNGVAYEQIGIVAAAGNTSSTSTYQFTDYRIDRLASNTMFYRLKQVDIDNHFRYSNIVRLNYNKGGTVPTIVYPNPTKGSITITVGDDKLIGTEAVLSDVNGRILQRIKITATSQFINMDRLVNGIYFIRLNNKEALKVVKQ